MKKTPFLDFLREKHSTIFTTIADDELPDNFDVWVTELQVDDWIDLGEEFALTLTK